MSIAAVVVLPDRVELLSDAAFVMPDGTLSEIRSKFVVDERARIAITGRGEADVLQAFWRGVVEIAEDHDYDATIAILSDLLANGAAREKHSEIIIAGVSATTGPTAHVLLMGPHTAAETMKPIQVQWYIGGPNNLPLGAPLFGLTMFASKIADAARATLAPPVGDLSAPPIYAVGGFAELGTITAAGITRQKVREWPEDRIGEKIAPT